MGHWANIGSDVQAPPIASKGGDRVGRQLVKSVGGDHLHGPRVNHCHAGAVCSAAIMAQNKNRACSGCVCWDDSKAPC